MSEIIVPRLLNCERWGLLFPSRATSIGYPTFKFSGMLIDTCDVNISRTRTPKRRQRLRVVAGLRVPLIQPRCTTVSFPSRSPHPSRSASSFTPDRTPTRDFRLGRDLWSVGKHFLRRSVHTQVGAESLQLLATVSTRLFVRRYCCYELLQTPKTCWQRSAA